MSINRCLEAEERVKEMQRYVERTKVKHKERYYMCCRDIRAIYAIADTSLYHAITFAFTYGQAKGYRAAKVEKRG